MKAAPIKAITIIITVRGEKTVKPVRGSKTVFSSAILTAKAAAARNRETIENKKTGFCITIISLFISINRYTIAH